MAFALVSVNDASVYDGKTLVISVTDAGTEKGPVVYGGVTQAPANVTWTNTTITVTDFDAGALPVDGSSYTLACYKPIAEEPAPAGDQWYVRSNTTTYGTGSGTDWNNAWSGFSAINWASVSLGDTIWVAGGTYTQNLVADKNGTSGSFVSVRRARADATACTTKEGWSAGFDSLVYHLDAGIYFWSGNDSNYMVISGRTTAAGGDLGWHVHRPNLVSGKALEWGGDANSSNVLIEYMDLEGPGLITYTPGGSGGRGLDLTPFSSATNNTFSHIKVSNWESGIMLGGMASPVFDHVDVSDMGSLDNAAWHPNGLYIVGSNNGTVRHCTFRMGDWAPTGEGVFFQGGTPTGWKIYGNLFLNLTATAKGISGKVPVQMEVYNNTFYNCNLTLYFSDTGTCAVGSAWRNNLVVDSSSPVACGTTTNNVVIGSSGSPGTPDPFVDKANNDFRIVADTGGSYPRDGGVALAAEFNTDRDGETRGSDGTWDIGAYEYV